MSVICSFDDLSELEELNNTLKIHCLALRVFLESAENSRYADRQDDFNFLIWLILEMLEQCSFDFSIWEARLRSVGYNLHDD